ncbi:MAG: DUF4242 domain-containing protein [Dehalococcoidia bacterium]|nr:DUF4242 domain-containing protein [Dehalococcoidia bacterium]
MPLYKIRRVIGPATQEDVDAAAFRAIVCAPQFPGLRWVHSYWDPAGGCLDCYYEAANPEQVHQHAELSRIPCDEVVEVQPVEPESYRSQAAAS